MYTQLTLLNDTIPLEASRPGHSFDCLKEKPEEQEGKLRRYQLERLICNGSLEKEQRNGILTDSAMFPQQRRISS